MAAKADKPPALSIYGLKAPHLNLSGTWALEIYMLVIRDFADIKGGK